MTTCAICLETVRETRSHVPIRCGHLFHSHCIDNWKHQGKNTCPICRKVFDGSNYRVQVTVHNLANENSNTVALNNIFALEVLDMFFNIENDIDLDSLLADFGVSMSDLDPLVLNTE